MKVKVIGIQLEERFDKVSRVGRDSDGILHIVSKKDGKDIAVFNSGRWLYWEVVE